MNVWLAQHHAALLSALSRLWRNPLNTLLSLFVMGIAMTLPGIGYVLLDETAELSRNASGVQQISLFMALGTNKNQLNDTQQQLEKTVPGQWRFVSRDDALQRLKSLEGMDEVVASLPKNPLPDAFIIEPKDTRPAVLENLKATFTDWPQVAHVQLDSVWVKRFDAFLRLGKLALSLIAALFAACLVAVTFNTIRLQVLAQAQEIELKRLIGATNGFICRPFQYFGALQGLLGAWVAIGMIALTLRLLNAPVSELASLYGTSFGLRGLTLTDLLTLNAAGAALGWVGAQLSVTLSLQKFD